MRSFVDRGHGLTLYSFETYNIPLNISQRPAEDIVDSSLVGRFMTGRKINLAHFSDLFRLLLFSKTDLCWVDVDMYCLDDKHIDWEPQIVLQEKDSSVLNCVLRLTDPEILERAISATIRLAGKDLPWAATQNALSKALKNSPRFVSHVNISEYSPFGFDDWYKVFLPEHAAECASLCEESRTLHLYNNILQKVGYLKSALPPEGSFLRHLLYRDRLEPLFKGEYDAQTVRALVESWHLRFSGEALGLGAVCRQAVPSLRRSFHRRLYTLPLT